MVAVATADMALLLIVLAFLSPQLPAGLFVVLGGMLLSCGILLARIQRRMPIGPRGWLQLTGFECICVVPILLLADHLLAGLLIGITTVAVIVRERAALRCRGG